MLLFGIGHKARSGKDTLGTYLSEHHGFHVVHFADALKEEALQAGWNPDNKNESARNVIARIMNKSRLSGNVSGLNTIERDIMIFCNSRKNDYLNLPESLTFLQWIGTEFRRTQNPQYWVKRTWDNICDMFMQALLNRASGEAISQLTDLGMDIRPSIDAASLMLGVDWFKVCVCDMRFINEYLAIKEWGGYTFDVRRTKDYRLDDSVTGEEVGRLYVPYTDPDRDPDHPSEIQLDGIPHNFTITSSSVQGIYTQADNIMQLFAQGGSKWLK